MLDAYEPCKLGHEVLLTRYRSFISCLCWFLVVVCVSAQNIIKTQLILTYEVKICGSASAYYLISTAHSSHCQFKRHVKLLYPTY